MRPRPPLTSSQVGTTADIERWFENGQARDGVPMWLVAQYVVASRDRMRTIDFDRRDEWVATARIARERAVADETRGFFFAIELCDLVATGKLDDALAELPRPAATELRREMLKAATLRSTWLLPAWRRSSENASPDGNGSSSRSVTASRASCTDVSR